MADQSQNKACLQGLACAALDPALRTVLVEDCPAPVLEALAAAWATLLAAAEGRPVTVASLASSFSEDDLWGRPDLLALQRTSQLLWQSGPLAQLDPDPAPRIICIPDLARQSLAVERAAVALIGVPLAGLQRYGFDTTMWPNLCWLAACEHRRIGEVSPHLLDRLVLRLPVPVVPQPDRVAALQALVDGAEPARPLWQGLDGLVEQVRSAAAGPPSVPRAALVAALRLLGNDLGQGMRRCLALARLGRALAWLAGAAETAEAHVEQAAALIGLAPLASVSPPEPPRAMPRPPEPDPMPEPTPPAADVTSPTAPPSTTVEPARVGPAEPLLVGPSDQEQVLPATSAGTPREPYPEDRAPVLRDRNALQLPSVDRRSAVAARGVVIGTRPADDTRDLALFETVLEALKHHALPGRHSPDGRLRFGRSDLRAYRRAPHPEHLLVLLLDYTSLRGCDWESALLPHLSWAYVARASVGLVQVGARSAREPLRAELLTARRLLDPRLDAALQAEPGAATPLAHGLELAARLLLVTLQHGRTSARSARLVVLSDGRGNVPLKASHNGRLDGPIGRAGLSDALAAAAELRAIGRVARVLLDPQPPQLAELPLALAEALGARIERVPRRAEEPRL